MALKPEQQAKFNLVCERIADGMSLRKACKPSDVISKKSFLQWIAENGGEGSKLSDQYARACEERGHALAEDVIEISDDGSNDWMQDNDPDNPGWKLNGEHIQRSKLRVDTRKWFASKLNGKYADKQTHTLTGPDNGPIQIEEIPARERVANRIASIAARSGPPVDT